MSSNLCSTFPLTPHTACPPHPAPVLLRSRRGPLPGRGDRAARIELELGPDQVAPRPNLPLPGGGPVQEAQVGGQVLVRGGRAAKLVLAG